MDRDLSSLTALYVAGLCGKGYGLRQIIEAQDKAGAPIDGIAISGGAGQSDLVRQILAEATGKPVVAVGTEEPVLLGSAMLAACAAGAVGNLAEGMSRMSQASRACVPAPGNVRKLHDDRYAASCALQSTARTIRETKAR